MVIDMVARGSGGSHSSSHSHGSYGGTRRSHGSTYHYHYSHTYHSSTGGHFYVSPWITWTLFGLIAAAVIAFAVYRSIKRRRHATMGNTP